MLLRCDEVGRDSKTEETGEATVDRAPRRVSRGAFFIESHTVANEG